MHHIFFVLKTGRDWRDGSVVIGTCLQRLIAGAQFPSISVKPDAQKWLMSLEFVYSGSWPLCAHTFSLSLSLTQINE